MEEATEGNSGTFSDFDSVLRGISVVGRALSCSDGFGNGRVGLWNGERDLGSGRGRDDDDGNGIDVGAVGLLRVGNGRSELSGFSRAVEVPF